MTGKREPPLRLDMTFAEAFERFAGTDPVEVQDSVERSKQEKPPGEGVPRRKVFDRALKSPARKR